MGGRSAVVVLGVAASVTALAAGCLGAGGSARVSWRDRPPCRSVQHTGSAAVPRVVGAGFTQALDRLLGRGFRVSVPHFTAFHEAPVAQGWGTLGDFHVTSQSIPPGILLPRGDVVTLNVDDAVFRGPIGSIVTPGHHPTYATVPDLVGMDYRRAMAAGDGYAGSGVFTRVGTTRPLPAAASACGLDAFVVAAQSPAPGTRVRWGGIRPDGRGIEPGVAAVTIDLAIRPPG